MILARQILWHADSTAAQQAFPPSSHITLQQRLANWAMQANKMPALVGQ